MPLLHGVLIEIGSPLYKLENQPVTVEHVLQDLGMDANGGDG